MVPRCNFPNAERKKVDNMGPWIQSLSETGQRPTVTQTVVAPFHTTSTPLPEIGKQIAQLLVSQLINQTIGHQRSGNWPALLDIRVVDVNQVSKRVSKDFLLATLTDRDPGKRGAVGPLDDPGDEAGRDVLAGFEH